MDIKQATKAYERWLAKRIPLLEPDLRVKHQRMAESPFPFLRATFYRWVQLWPKICHELATAPSVLGVGDLHVENFGTWRDREGRLVWGINDFDEATQLPYTNDLVRLAASARIAISENQLSCDADEACEAILIGYQEGIASGGAAFVLAEKHGWLRDLAMSKLRDPVAHWQKLDRLPTQRVGLPVVVRQTIGRLLPEPRQSYRIVHRRAGLGSLGRRRFTVLAPAIPKITMKASTPPLNAARFLTWPPAGSSASTAMCCCWDRRAPPTHCCTDITPGWNSIFSWQRSVEPVIPYRSLKEPSLVSEMVFVAAK